jgi:hypothetical protein
MITNDELSQKLYEAWCAQMKKDGFNLSLDWDHLQPAIKRCWSAVANAAWELVEGENAIWAAESDRRAEELSELLIEFVNRAEALIG